jgi:chromosome segregation ATPase
MEDLGQQIDSARDTFTAKNQRITSLATDVDLAEASLETLNERVRTMTEAAEELQQKADEVRRSDTKGAFEIVEESARKSAEAERTIAQQLERIGGNL